MVWPILEEQDLATNFTTTYYVPVYKTIYMYYLKKSHDSLKDRVWLQTSL